MQGRLGSGLQTIIIASLPVDRNTRSVSEGKNVTMFDDIFRMNKRQVSNKAVCMFLGMHGMGNLSKMFTE